MTTISDNIDNRTVSQKEWDQFDIEWAQFKKDFNMVNDAVMDYFKNGKTRAEVERRTVMPGDDAATIAYKQEKEKEYQCEHEEALLENNRINLAKEATEKRIRLAKEEIEEEIRYKHRQRDNDDIDNDLETIVLGLVLFEIAKAEYIR